MQFTTRSPKPYIENIYPYIINLSVTSEIYAASIQKDELPNEKCEQDLWTIKQTHLTFNWLIAIETKKAWLQ